MKLASLKHGRYGRLIVVSRDLEHAVEAPGVATLQAALDDWPTHRPALQETAASLAAGNLDDAFPFDPINCAAPLPRAYQWADGSAYLHHAELVRRARGAELPESLRHDPLMYQGGSDGFLGPRDDIAVASEDHGIDFEAEIAVVTGDVPMGIAPSEASAHILLVMLANDVSFRHLIPEEIAKGFGFFQSKPATSFSPVAVTPDELGEAWDGGKLHLALRITYNGEIFGTPDAGADMAFDFPALIAHAAKTRHLVTGTIIGSGTVSNRDRARGSACLAERRALETIDHGAPRTPFMRFGDQVRIEMLDESGQSLFGAIDQTVTRYESAAIAAASAAGA